jgi:hypothetical protein
MFPATVVDKIETRILCSIIFFPKNPAEKYGTARKARDDNIRTVHFLAYCIYIDLQ